MPPSLASKFIESKYPVNWHWPIHFGLLPKPENQQIVDDIQDKQYAARLSYSYVLNSGRRSCNLLVLEGNFTDAIRQVREFSFPVKADLILLFMPENSKVDLKLKRAPELLVKMTGASGFFFTTGIKDISNFCEGIVYHLSHNQNIKTALTSVLDHYNVEGFLFQSKELDEQSKLASQFEKLLNNLKGIPNDQLDPMTDHVFTRKIKDRISNFIPSNIKDIIPENRGENIGEKLINIFSKAGKHFQYDNESDEASILAEIAINAANVVPEQTVNIKFNKKRAVSEFESTVTAPRYLQCKFSDDQHATIFSILNCNANYKLHVRIGPSDPVWLQGSKVAPEKIKVDPKKPEEVRIVIVYDEQIQSDFITLPYKGASSEGIFNINQSEPGEKTIEVFAYHKDRLLQSVALNVNFQEEGSDSARQAPANLENIYNPRVVLDNLDKRTEFGLSIIQNITNSEKKLLLQSSDNIENYKLEAGLEKYANEIKYALEEAVANPDDYPTDLMDPQNFALLRSLALKGSTLHKNYLKSFTDNDNPIQIISSRGDYIPIEFIYTKEITRKTKAVCPNAVAALKAGKCEGCNEKNENGDPYLCPFGFVGLRNIIERHDIGNKNDLLEQGDFGIYSEPSGQRQNLTLLKNTIFGSSQRLDKHTANLSDAVNASIAEVSVKSTKVDNWDDWAEEVEKNHPDSLVIIGHVEKEQTFGDDLLEIGEDKLEKGFINSEYISGKDKLNMPIVILIGCGTQDLNIPFLDFSSCFKNNGAALVLSTFTKIRGRHAGPIVQKLFEYLHSRKGETFKFGELLLKLKQHLLSEGLIISLAMVAHGDADWQIKL